jgi:hypothetical protein
MLQSHVIEIDGAFVGAAVRLDTGYRFVATDTRLEELNGTTMPSLAEVRRLAHRLFRSRGFIAQSETTPHRLHSTVASACAKCTDFDWQHQKQRSSDV